MRADRLLSIVLLLQTHHHMTSRDLASRLEVSERTIHRDMDALSGAGIPVVAARGSGGGWSLLGEYRTDLTGLTETEIQSLFVTKPTKLLADLRLGGVDPHHLWKPPADFPRQVLRLLIVHQYDVAEARQARQRVLEHPRFVLDREQRDDFHGRRLRSARPICRRPKRPRARGSYRPSRQA